MKALHRLLPAGWLLMLFSAGMSAQTITSFSPVSAAAGETITITGTGFSGTPANNIVRFGNVRGTVTLASGTSLSVTVPAGAMHAPVSVTVLGTGKTAISSLRFSRTFNAGELGSGAFTLDETIAGLAKEPYLIDMDEDGKLDILLSRYFVHGPDQQTLGYLRNTSTTGSISFASVENLPVEGWDVDRIVTADLDTDGKLDYVFVGDFVRVFRDNGTPGNPNFQLWEEIFNPDMTGGYWRREVSEKSNLFFMAMSLLDYDPLAIFDTYPSSSSVWVPSYLTQMNANDAIIRDFNGDGRLDIAVAYSGNDDLRIHGRVRIFTYNDLSFFPVPVTKNFTLWRDIEIREPFNNKLHGFSLEAGDINGDGRMDLIVAGNFLPYGPGMVTFIINLPSRLALNSWEPPAKTERVVIADFDNDAKLDVAYQMFPGTNQISVFRKIVVARNVSTPDSLRFETAAEISMLGERTLQAADLDGDGKTDMLWACEGCSGFSAVRNTSTPGAISFSSPTAFSNSVEFQRALSVGDLDGDGRPEVVSVGSNVNISRNTLPSYSLVQSIVTVNDPSIAKNDTTTVFLQMKDVVGNNVNLSGLTVSFSLSGSGSSAGTFGSTTDNGGGHYSAVFTGTNVGTARSLSGSIGGTPVTSTLPTITVAGGANSVAQSMVTISRPVVAAGATAVVMFQAKDSNGDTLTTGGLAGVTFFLAGSGTSSGTFGSVTDSSNGKYYATFTASTAGTAKNIRALLGTDTVQTTQPTVTVIAGVFSTANSVITIASNPILKYDTTTVTVQIKDGSNNNITTGGLNVKIEIFGSANPINNGKAYLTDVIDNENGTYTSKLIGLTVSSGTAITASIYNSGTTTYQSVNSFPSPVSVDARPLLLSRSTVDWGTPGDSTLYSGATTYFTLYARNDKGEAYTESNLAVTFSLDNDGTSTLTAQEAPHNDGGGVYSALYLAAGVGTARTILTTVSSNPITSTAPTIAVVPIGNGILYPGHFQENVPVDTIFSWSSVTGATSYRVVLVADSVDGAVIIDSSGVTATEIAVSSLSHYRTYHWWFSSFHQDLEGPASASRMFTTSIGSPDPIFPYDQTYDLPFPTPLSWDSTFGATSYRLQVASDTGFTRLITDESGLTTTVDTLFGLSHGTKYYWRVRGDGSSGSSAFSAFRSFTTAATASGQAILYVKTDGNDNADGSSWGTAFATVQKALTAAEAGGQIWVAAATYKPTTTSDRSISFVLKNGVALYGGFAGSESNLNQRNWETNVTILSGDIDGDATTANNSYHVVVGNTFATARLDGFTITGGNADANNGGGVYCSGGYPTLANLVISGNRTSTLGGGMYNLNGSPTLVNVTFSGNVSDDKGGGLYNEYGHPIISGCSFINNSAFDGGGMYSGTFSFPAPESNPTFTDVVFKSNTGTGFGGGFANANGSPVFRNVLFHQNVGGIGGGIFNHRGNLLLASVTISNNNSNYGGSSEGGGMYNSLSSPTLKNVILWGNTNNQIYNVLSSTVTLFHSLVQNGGPGLGGILNFNGSVDADSGGNLLDNDPLFVNAGTGDLSLSAESPAVDSGMNDAVATVSDLGGNPRIDGGTVDIGAYETQFAAASFSAAISRADSTNLLGSTNLELSFSGIAPDRTVLVFSSRYQTPPDSVTFSGSAPANYSPFRWVLAKSGDPFSSADLSIDNVSTYPGVVDPSGLVIYRRSSTGAGDFAPLTTTYDAGTDKLTATITSFSEFMIGSNNNPLPVQMSSFTAAVNRMNAELRWRTESEVGNYGFEIERRVMEIGGQKSEVGGQRSEANNSQFAIHLSAGAVSQAKVDDSQPWRVVGFVQGSGTSSSPKDYSFVDKQLPPARYAYRIKQIDHSGSSTYTSSLEVEVGIAPLVFALAQNYPNPFNPTTTIEFTLPEDGRVKLRIYNMLGEEVVTLVDEERKAGVYQQVVFDASRLATGLYISRLEFKEKQLIKKMLLVK